jgi:hypothetical protein
MVKQLFTKQDIERFGFTYEPNEERCTIVQLRLVFTDFDNKTALVKKVHFQNIHSIYFSNGNAYVKGHGNIVSI